MELLVGKWNQECDFTKNIKSSYLEEGDNNLEINLESGALVECILSKYDPQLFNHSGENILIFLRKRIMEICSIIELESFNDYKFNKEL